MKEAGNFIRRFGQDYLDFAKNNRDKVMGVANSVMSDNVATSKQQTQQKESKDMSMDQGILGLFGNTQDLGTQQASSARDENQGVAANKTREQLLWEAEQDRKNAAYKEAEARRTADYTAVLGNKIANAGTARSMAFDTTQNLNRMYATAGDRLNAANQTTQANLAAAANTIAGMFR
jgi:hypothetical protein